MRIKNINYKNEMKRIKPEIQECIRKCKMEFRKNNKKARQEYNKELLKNIKILKDCLLDCRKNIENTKKK